MSASSKDGFLAMMGSLSGLSVFAIALRLFARRHQRQPIMADDYFALLSCVSTTWSHAKRNLTPAQAAYLVAVTCEARSKYKVTTALYSTLTVLGGAYEETGLYVQRDDPGQHQPQDCRQGMRLSPRKEISSDIM